MHSKPSRVEATHAPLVREEGDTLSLHFGFPTIQSQMRKSAPEELILDYTRTMMGFLVLQPKPQRIAMIGLGGGSLAKYCRHRLPDTDFTAVELSPEVIALRDDFGVPADCERFRVICADGADFLQTQDEAFDVVLIDGFDAGGQPTQLCSASFYDSCRAALRPGGILVVNLCADDTACGSYIARIGVAFDDLLVAVDAEEGENTIVFAGKNAPFPPSFPQLTERLRTLEAEHPVDLARTTQIILRSNAPRRAGHGRRR